MLFLGDSLQLTVQGSIFSMIPATGGAQSSRQFGPRGRFEAEDNDKDQYLEK